MFPFAVIAMLNYFSGHLQTMYCIMGDFSKNDLMWYSRYVAYVLLSERTADASFIGLT
jgi:hypothetical protein